MGDKVHTFSLCACCACADICTVEDVCQLLRLYSCRAHVLRVAAFGKASLSLPATETQTHSSRHWRWERAWLGLQDRPSHLVSPLQQTLTGHWPLETLTQRKKGNFCDPFLAQIIPLPVRDKLRPLLSLATVESTD